MVPLDIDNDGAIVGLVIGRVDDVLDGEEFEVTKE